MLVLFTPFSFLFLLFYFIFLFILFYCPDFFSFWVVIECSSLIFMGMSYSFMSFGFSNLMLYFIIQAVSSVNIFVFYSLSIDSLVLFFLFLKLALFPFFMWYMVVISKLGNFMFFLTSTIQNLPTLLIFYFFVSQVHILFFWFCMTITVICCSLFMFSSLSFRTFIAFSSVGSNCWFLISSFCGFDFLLLFFVFYSLNFYLVLSFLGMSYKLDITDFSSSVYFFFSIISLAGFPPFPPFFINLYIVYFLSTCHFVPSSFLLMFLLFVVYMLSSYIRFSLSYFVNHFSNSMSVIYAVLFL